MKNVSKYMAEIFRFALVGVIAAGIQYVLFWFTEPHMPYRLAFLMSFFISVIFNYIASTLFTFKVSGSPRKLASFIGGHICNLFIQWLGLELFSLILPHRFAMLASMACAFPINFLIIKYILTTNMKTFISYLKLLRVEQWVKNLFVFLPIFFDSKIFDVNYLIPTAWTALMFSLVCSMVYIMNDIKDVEADRNHPEKCKRPIAAGIISVRMASVVWLLCLCGAAAIGVFAPVNIGASMIIASYFVLQILYTFWLKKVSIIDVAIIALGFVLRVISGGVASDTMVSPWIIVMTFLITLFMAFAKRRDDVLLLEQGLAKPRKNTDRYSLAFINIVLSILASVTVVAYLLYCLSPSVIEHYHTDKLYITSIFVLLALLHYLQLALVDNKSGNPTKILLHDYFIQAMIVLFVVFFGLIIYVF